jgi:biopolymer transport protein ExbD
MNWLVRADVILLGLFLAYTVAAVVHISRRTHTARCDGDMDRARRANLAAELNIQAGNLKSIATTAPYVGTVGTCLGIMGAFPAIAMEKHAALALIMSRLAAALVPAAAGIIVVVPATCACEYARRRLDLLANELPDRKPLLTRWFTLPPFALMGAYALVILVQAYMPLAPGHSPKGFDVGIAPARCGSDLANKLLVLHLSNDGRVFLNQEEQGSTLQSRLSAIYSMRADRTLYLFADEGVPFQTVADTIDTVENTSETGTSLPLNITIRLIAPSARDITCPKPVKVRFSKP